MYPDHNFRLCFDLLILLLLLYTVTITPVRLGFEMQPATWSTEFWMETFIDLCFMVDVFLNCFTSYEQDDGHMITEVDLRRVVSIAIEERRLEIRD